MAAQTTYSTIPANVAFAGDLVDARESTNLVFSRAASEAIPFGVLVEHETANTFRVWRGTGKVAGVSMRKLTRMGGAYAPGASAAYQAGDQVPVLRSGRIFVSFESNAAGTRHAAPNFWIPSTNGSGNLAKLGFATSRATAGTTGAEIGATPAASLFWESVASTDTIAAVEVNFTPTSGPTGATGATGATGPTGP